MRTPILLAALLLAAPAWAETPDAATRGSARKLGEEGNALFDQGNYAAALEKYERADTLVHVPTLGLKAARCLEKLGRWVEASERYLGVTRMQLAADALEVHHEAQTQAAAEREALLPRIPSLVIKLSGAKEGVSVTIDGKAVPSALIGEQQLVDPGEHRLEARLGEQVQTRTFTATEAQTSSVNLDFAAPPPSVAAPPPPTKPAGPSPELDRGSEPGSGQRTLGLIVGGVGVVGVAAGAVTGLMASGKRSDLEKQCGDDLECPPSAWDDADSYNGLRTVSTVGFIGGAVCLVAGGVLFLTAPSGSATPVMQGRGGALRFRF